MKLLIKGSNIYTGAEVLKKGFVLIESGLIAGTVEMANLPAAYLEGADVIELNETSIVIPGMIDLHIHGAAGADVMDGTVCALEKIACTLPAEGTTSFLATTLTESERKIKGALLNVGKYIKNQSAGKSEVLGIHLEGPFISPKRPGAQASSNILKPEIKKFREFQVISDNHIRLVTLAPERPGGMELIEYLRSEGIIASIGHSDANGAEVRTSVKAGVTHVTHLFNAMSPLHHRNPGVAGSVLVYDELLCEIIADGIHVHPDIVRLAFKMKGREGMVLVTDAIRAKCLGDGYYSIGSQTIKVENGRSFLEDGTLAGSILTMNDSIKNTLSYTGCTMEDIVYMTSINPAKQLNLFHKKGSLEQGKDADIVILDENLEVTMTFCKGIMAYKKGQDEKDLNN